jgi:DNA-binding XRE family transcriptional regulator
MDGIDPLSVAIGARLRELREKKGISQDALALKSGIHRTVIGRVERGETNISVKTLHKLCDALDICCDVMGYLRPAKKGK